METSKQRHKKSEQEELILDMLSAIIQPPYHWFLQFPAYRRPTASRLVTSTYGTVAPDQNLPCMSVIGEGMLARECHSLDAKQKAQYASSHTVCTEATQ